MDDKSNSFIGLVDNCNNLYCENMATIMCERCSEGYCSIVCQKMDWRQHKKTCIPFPGVVPYESPYLQGQSMLPQKIIHNRKSSTVNIMWSSATASPIQDESPSNAQKLLETPKFQGKSLSSIATALLGPKSDIKVKTEGSEPELQDKLSSLPKIEKAIDYSLKSLSIAATPIAIDDDNSKQKIIAQDLKNFQCNEELVKSLPPSPHDSPQASIKESNKENLMKLVTKKNTLQRFTLQDVLFKKIPTGRNIDIFTLDDSSLKTLGYVCCTYFENQVEANEFHNNMNKVHTYGQRARKEVQENYIPGIDEICVVLLKDDERWYRAHCVSHDGDDMITIMFLDFGNVQKTHKSEILPITKDLLYPVYANFCYIDGYKIGKPNPEVDKYIVAIKGFKCSEIIKGEEPGSYIVKLDM